MALRIQVVSEFQRNDFEHRSGPLEFGRGTEREMPRRLLDDPTVSRDQLRVEELPGNRVRLENLSTRIIVAIAGHGAVAVGDVREFTLPISLQVGKSRIAIAAADRFGGTIEGGKSDRSAPDGNRTVPFAIMPPAGDTIVDRPIIADRPIDVAGLVSVPPPVSRGSVAGEFPATHSGDRLSADTAQRLADWLQAIIELQTEPPGSASFHEKTARALVELIGLDLGLVLLRQQGGWQIAGAATANDTVTVQYSRKLVDYVARERLCFYEDLNKLGGPSTVSLMGVEAAVAAPIFGINGEAIGMLYGARVTSGIMAKGVIDRLEAQCVQLLAGAVGANLSRELAIKTRMQFEQFFSTDLARELERNPNLLEGRTDEITILFSDLRGFTPLAQRLSAATICRMMRDVMERLTYRIIEFGGVIVDFAGDGVFAMWNAPSRQADHARRACRAALAMVNELPALNERWAADLLPGERLSLGIGVNTGEAQVGNTGSSRRLKYGPQGHAVNLASRVQSATDKLRLPLLITSSTRGMLPDAMQTRRLGNVRLAGITEPEVLYELHGELAAPEWLARRDAYEAALAQFEAQQWLQAFHRLLPIVGTSDDPSRCDGPTVALMRRTWECLEAPPQPFDAIVEVIGK